MLEIGIKGKIERIINEKESAKNIGSGELDVLSTPIMIALIEETSWKSIKEKLNEEDSTVGTKLEISHLSPTPIGAKVWCETELISIEGRKLIFNVDVYDEFGKVGEGKHERFIVNKEKFLKKVDSKK